MTMLALAVASALAVAAPLAKAQPYPDRSYDHPYAAPDRNDVPYDRRDRRDDDRRDVMGCDVRYEYRGRQYETRLDHDPGRSLVVGQDTRPDGTPYDNANPYPERPGNNHDRR